MKKTDKKIIDELLDSEASVQMLAELGLQDASREDQAVIFATLGGNTINRMFLELLKALPESDHPEFERLFAEKDLEAMQKFIEPRIPDFEKFLQHEAMKEYEATKTRMHEIAQGIDI